MKRLLRIKLKKERVILSDTLPYETPITFSNRFFYDFIVKNSLECDDKVIKWKKNSEADEAVIHILLGLSDEEKSNITEEGNIRSHLITNRTFVTIPFQYGISHKEDSYRQLSVTHPRNQIQTVYFYEKYKELILYHSERSNFSLRYPSRVANTRLFDDERKSVSVLLSDEFEKNITNRNKSLKSYFGYQKIRNIHEFFESNAYHQCEKNMTSWHNWMYRNASTQSTLIQLLGRHSVKK